MLVLARNLILSAEEAALPSGTPLIGWHNLVTFDNVSADTEAADYPATNLANPATNLEWRAANTTEQYLTVAVASIDPVDYVGIARHNLSSAVIAVSVGYFDDEDDWVELVAPFIPRDDAPLLLVFTAQSLVEIKVKFAVGTAAARAAVLYVGKLLVCERGVVPDADLPVPTFARKTSVVNGRSEAGDYLGRVVLGQFLEWNASFKHFLPDWYRTNFDPFVAAAQDDVPFFYAWSPVGYPYEVVFAWFTDDPIPLTNPVTGRVGVDIVCSGIVT